MHVLAYHFLAVFKAFCFKFSDSFMHFFIKLHKSIVSLGSQNYIMEESICKLVKEQARLILIEGRDLDIA